ncbi:hypothetical protein PROFUN_06718 [Planoprotostelium fungivorum]|uniref:F-box domain-containing protein n=1 Tax=Planoprotostelium fungivorum TaxID=1890364 RepID=A0A2P6NG75_9EUKA|nr:hypothetical protein PROFUN_06718 [Planoprotostelium fungivorum]
MQHIPDELWTNVFDFLPTPDLCSPCFTSTTFLDAARHIINNRISDSSNWWRHRKQLPVHSKDVIQWWLSTIREPTRLEVMEVIQRDVVEALHLLGWSDEHLSSRHRLLTREDEDERGWCWKDILEEATIRGSKKTISILHAREETIDDEEQWLSSSDRLGRTGNLEMIRWALNDAVDGLPNFDWCDLDPDQLHSLAWEASKSGHSHVIVWLKQRGLIDEEIGTAMYGGAGEGGRMDMLMWLEESEIPCEFEDLSLFEFIGSLSALEWAKKHDVENKSPYPTIYESALEGGCTDVMRYCFENREGLPETEIIESYPMHNDCLSYEAIQLAIDHKLITKDSAVLMQENSTMDLSFLQWMHDRGTLNADFVEEAASRDHLGILQWAVEKGYSFDRQSMNIAMHCGSPDLLEWLIEKYDVKEEQMYEKIVERSSDQYENPRPFNLLGLEWLLQRKWKKSEEESTLHRMTVLLEFRYFWFAFADLKTTNNKRDVLAANLRRLTDEEADGPNKVATAAWITTASERELNGWLTFSKQAFIDAVKAKGPTTQASGIKQRMEQAAQEFPIIYSRRLAAVSPFFFLEPFQQAIFYTATFNAFLIITFFATRRAILASLNQPTANPSSVEKDLCTWSAASFYGRGAALAYIATFIGVRTPEYFRRSRLTKTANTATGTTTKAVDTATKTVNATTKAIDTATPPTSISSNLFYIVGCCPACGCIVWHAAACVCCVFLFGIVLEYVHSTPHLQQAYKYQMATVWQGYYYLVCSVFHPVCTKHTLSTKAYKYYAENLQIDHRKQTSSVW